MLTFGLKTIPNYPKQFFFCEMALQLIKSQAVYCSVSGGLQINLDTPKMVDPTYLQRSWKYSCDCLAQSLAVVWNKHSSMSYSCSFVSLLGRSSCGCGNVRNKSSRLIGLVIWLHYRPLLPEISFFFFTFLFFPFLLGFACNFIRSGLSFISSVLLHTDDIFCSVF